MKRVESLIQIITFGQFREQAFSALAKFGFDSDVEQVDVADSMLADVLQLFLCGSISTDELEVWANFVECRDDINCDRNEGTIYALSNPEIMGEINTENIIKMVDLLKI